jgi:serine/threonine protein kinase
MIPSELKVVCDKITGAVRPEDLFGADPLLIKVKFTSILKTIFPDLHRNDEDAFKLANESTIIVNILYDKAKSRIGNGTYGYVNNVQSLDIKIQTSKTSYDLVKKIHEGGTYDIYTAKNNRGEDFIVKITCKEEYDYRVRREARVLMELKLPDDETQRPFLPTFIECFKTSDQRNGIIFKKRNTYDMFEINDMMPQGVPTEHLVWILKRILKTCQYFHHEGVLHGAINPGHILIEPDQHTIQLVDWTHSVTKPSETGEKYRSFSLIFNPPEVKDNEKFSRSSDLYSVGKVMVFIAGGNMETLKMPEHVHTKLKVFISWFISNNIKQRPGSAGEALKYLDMVVNNIFGKDRIFVPFILPIQ